jgi:hypothetical protein
MAYVIARDHVAAFLQLKLLIEWVRRMKRCESLISKDKPGRSQELGSNFLSMNTGLPAVHRAIVEGPNVRGALRAERPRCRLCSLAILSSVLMSRIDGHRSGGTVGPRSGKPL